MIILHLQLRFGYLLFTQCLSFTLDNSFESEGCENWFEAKSEDAINPMRAMSTDQITEGLKHAIQNWKKSMKKFGFISNNKKKRSHDWKPTVARGPTLSTEKRFGKTRREVEGEKLKEERYRRNVLQNVTKPRFLRF